MPSLSQFTFTSFAALIAEAARWGVDTGTAAKPREAQAIAGDLARASGQHVTYSASSPQSRASNSFILNSNT
jgi:hypothetical protein